MEPVLRALSGLALGWIQRACSFARSGILAGDTGTRADHACATCCFTRWAVRTGAGGGATGQLVLGSQVGEGGVEPSSGISTENIAACTDTRRLHPVSMGVAHSSCALKRALAEGRQQIGLWCSLPSAFAAEIGAPA